MKKHNYISKLGTLGALFIGIPVFIYTTGGFEKRSDLMEMLSLITILAFSLIISQFFTNRTNKKLVKTIRMVNVLKVHKFIGYVFISLILVHPFFIILPKLSDNGLDASDALTRILTTFSSTGVILGLIAYSVMLILLVTSFFRFKIHLKYRTWRNLHGYLSLIFMITAAWHVINLGRHSNSSFTMFYILGATIGILLLLKTYVLKPFRKK